MDKCIEQWDTAAPTLTHTTRLMLGSFCATLPDTSCILTCNYYDFMGFNARLCQRWTNYCSFLCCRRFSCLQKLFVRASYSALTVWLVYFSKFTKLFPLLSVVVSLIGSKTAPLL